MDHINTNSFIDSSITTKILKVNVSDHLTFFFFFAVVVVNELYQIKSNNKEIF